MVQRFASLFVLAVLPLTVALAGTSLPTPNSPPLSTEAFENSVRPVLATQCVSCHGPTQQLGGVRLDKAPTMAQAKKLIAAIGYAGKIKMPPSGKLSESDRVALTRWVNSGATFPKTPTASGGKGAKSWPYTPIPVKNPPLAPPIDSARTDIDAFLLAKLNAHGLTFAPPADRRTLIRRVSFDLTGLPPTPERVEAFVADTRPDAYAKLVDELLASPAYGERWGRRWLDVARYADSTDARALGSEGDITEAWRYRDWVISAFNADLPYTDFIRLQLAGDLYGDPIPTGFLAIGNWGNGDADKDKILTDIADDQVDVTSKAFLGLTVGCARCHDHKFDPITTKDYYSLAGIFFSSHILPRLTPKGQGEVMLRIPLETPEQQVARTKLADVDKRIAADKEAARKAVAAKWVQEATQGRILDQTRWDEFIGSGGHPTLRTAFQHAGDITGVDGVRGDKDALSATINTTDKVQKFSTLALPPRSVSVHPAPSSGVAAVWKAERSEVVAVEASLADSDPVCGDGFLWELRQGETALEKGKVENGGKSPIIRRSVTVKEGDELLLCVLPGGEYTCDTTTVTFKVNDHDLTNDALMNVGKGEFGQWRFVDLGTANRTPEEVAVVAAWKTSDRQKALTLAAALPPDQLEKSGLLPDSELSLTPEAKANRAALEQERAALLPLIPATMPIANGVAEGGVPGSPHEGVHDVHVHHRGRYDNLGELVPRGAPVVLGGGPLPIHSGSGRRELAQWIASNQNPMTARVIANRVWQGHFGRGIVGTPSNFGLLGEKATNPELLDWLAAQFIRDGWRLKTLHRLILLSDAYKQSSVPSAAAIARDPDNRLLSRAPRQRLEAEALRDSLLAVSGKLDPTPGGMAFKDIGTPRRTVYAMTIRSDRTGFGPLFDSADSTNSIEKRTVSTVAPQALYLMNSPFALAQAQVLAARLRAHPGTDSDRIDYAYRLLYARPPSVRELTLGTSFLTHLGADGWDAYAQALLCTNEFSYVD